MSYNSPAPMNPNEKPMGGAQYMGGAPSASGQSGKWAFGLFDCCSPTSTCCLGFWCPCIIFGKTYEREHGKADPSCCNLMCCVWYLAAQTGFHSCLQCVIRGQQRERYGIEGGACGDFCTALCCSCCALIQEEKESVVKKTGIDPKTNVAYQPVGNGMQYPA